MGKRLAVVSILAAMLAAPALADPGCPGGYQDFPTDQLNEQMKVLLDEGSSDLMRALAFDELLCSDKESVRALALREVLTGTTSPSLRSHALSALVMTRSTFVIEFEPAEGLQRETYDAIKKLGGSIAIDVVGEAKERGSLRVRSVTLGNHLGSLDVSGDALNVTVRKHRGALIIGEDGVLRGKFYIDDTSEGAPVKLKLF